MAKTRTLGVLLSALAATVAIEVSEVGAQQRAVGVTPPRLSFLDGEVSYWRPGAEDWVPAQINTALAAGDSLYAAAGGNVELEIQTRAFVRAGSGTELGIESLETGYLQLRVPAGHAVVDLQRLPEGQQIELDTPNGAFLIGNAGYYRFDVDDQTTRFSVRRGGLGRVVGAGGNDELEVGSGQTVIVSGTETARMERVALTAEDAWDRWNHDRTAPFGEQPRSAQYVAPDVAGVDDLDRYGDWRATPDYGNVWMPRGVGADWAPYTTGRWVWDGYYGWTWVDDSPWGWAPYHYGRWCRVGSNWGWAPGPIVARPVYSPALVAFFGGGGVSVGIGTPFVSWVALGWGEPVVPWWGPRGFVGRPYWGGWGGPRYVNNVQINNTTIVNVNNIHRYDNFRHRGVVGIDGDRFGRGRGRIEHVRVDGDRLRNLRPVRGELAVRPVRESLVPRGGRGERPPDRIQNRRVVATRAPQDPARQPRTAGLVPSDSRRQPAPRIVAPRGDRAGSRAVRGDRAVPPVRGNERIRGATGNPESRDARGRIQGGEAARRGVPQAPAASRRVPAERDRNGREIGRSTERRGADRAPTPPATNRNAERTRPDTRTPTRVAPPPTDASKRGGSRNDQIRQPSPPQQERSRSRVQQPERAPRTEAPRQSAPARQQRIEQPRQAPPPQRNQRSPGGAGGRSSIDRRSIERQSAPRPQRQEQPRMQRQQQPRQQREAAPRVQRQQQPRQQRQAAPRVQRQQQPRQQRQAPRVERGGGDQRSGGGRTRDRGKQRGRDS